MIYKFRMISGEEKAFLRDYEIDSNQTFFDFHKLIQSNLNFDSNQLASFFLADEEWNKGLELTLLDMENEGGPAAIPMDSVKIKEILKEKKERLLYVYDIFNDNLLFIELMDVFPPDCKKKYPICSASVGEAPVQLGIQNSSTDSTFSENDIDEIFDEYNSEDIEFGSEGFDGDDE